MRFRQDPVVLLAVLVAILAVLAALLAPVLAPGDPYDNNLAAAMQPPGGGHLLGTDDQGRDMVARLLFGLRLTLLMGASSVLVGGGIGGMIGLFAAFYRRLDGVLMRCMDVLLSFPAILFGLSLAAIFGPGVVSVTSAMALATVPLTARIVRGAAAAEMARDYIEAAQGRRHE